MSGFFCLTFSKYSILSVFILPSNQNLYWVSLMHWRKPTRSQGEPANSWDLNSATHCSANIQTHRTVCATYSKDASCVRNDADSLPGDFHGGDQRPLVGLRAVKFTAVQTMAPIETTTNVNLESTGEPVSSTLQHNFFS